MRTRRASTPLAVKLLVAAILVGGPTWWLAQRQDRVGNENRLSEIASAIAGRHLRVRCPGVRGRVFSWDTVEGSVRFGADGRPADEARLRAFACAELDALAHESYHLAGIVDEGETECRAMQTLSWTAQQLGATPEQGRALTARYVETGYRRLPARYRLPGCELPGTSTAAG